MASNPELESTSPTVLFDNAKRLNKLANGPVADVPDRGDDPLYSRRQVMTENDEIRQDITPFSKQYATLVVAQVDVANIPEGSTTCYRSPGDSVLAIEIIDVGGTLTATGRKMPSSRAVDSVRGLIDSQGEHQLPVAFKNGLSPFGYEDGQLYAGEFQGLYSSDAGLESGGNVIDNNPPDGWCFAIYYRSNLMMCG